MRRDGLSLGQVDHAIRLYNLGWRMARVGQHLAPTGSLHRANYVNTASCPIYPQASSRRNRVPSVARPAEPSSTRSSSGRGSCRSGSDVAMVRNRRMTSQMIAVMIATLRSALTELGIARAVSINSDTSWDVVDGEGQARAVAFRGGYAVVRRRWRWRVSGGGVRRRPRPHWLPN
jgi:hypothetical protein